MGKAFFDVFPYVKLENRLKARMEQVTVQKIVNVTSGGFLRVHIESSYLIPKEDIYDIFCGNAKRLMGIK